MPMELKACPFCGSKATLRKVASIYGESDMRSLGYGGYFVLCMNCLTSGNNYATPEKAVDAWNRRVNDGA